MRGFKLNFITIFAFVLLLSYGYFAAMGWLYQNDGNIIKAGIFYAGVVGIISLCIYLMCKAKATRWDKIGIPGQVCLGMLIVVIFMTIGTPFSSYLSVLQQRNDINADIQMVINQADSLNISYNEYAHERVLSYRQYLEAAGGEVQKADVLNQQILPPTIGQTQENRKNWLKSIEDLRLSNVQTPNNIALIGNCVQQWQDDYQQLSAVRFLDEPEFRIFENQNFKVACDNFKNKVSGYSAWAFIVAILCAIFMLLPYFTTETWIGGENDNIIKKMIRVVSNDKNDDTRGKKEYE